MGVTKVADITINHLAGAHKIDTYTFGSGARSTLLEGTSAELIRGLAVDATHVYVVGRYQSVTRVDLATGKS